VPQLDISEAEWVLAFCAACVFTCTKEVKGDYYEVLVALAVGCRERGGYCRVVCDLLEELIGERFDVAWGWVVPAPGAQYTCQEEVI
jgi:hypothetical protein